MKGFSFFPLLPIILVAGLLVTSCPRGGENDDPPALPERNISAVDYVHDMNIGVNIGTFTWTAGETGANNTCRFLLISGYWTDIDRTCDSLFVMPTDSGINDRLIVSVHYYTPAIFCIAEETNSSWGFQADWGRGAAAGADNEELIRQFDELKARFISIGIPVIIGEYNAVRNGNKVPEGRIRWLTAVTKVRPNKDFLT